MADYIPFVYSEKDCQMVQKFYPDSAILRLSLDTLSNTRDALPRGAEVWLDPAIDGLDDFTNAAPRWQTFVKQFAEWEAIIDPDFQKTPERDRVERFVAAVLNACLKNLSTAQWLSVPQLPVVAGASRNKINRQLAQGTRKWRQESKFRGKMILPVIFTHQEQVNLKTHRAPHLALASRCYGEAGADGVWIVESSLSDQDGAGTFEQRRFPGILGFHEELAERLPRDTITIAGPYWGMNLVLWARGSVRYPAINLGSAYQYHLPGGVLKRPKTRVAVPPLRRWVVASPQFEIWLKRVVEQIPHEGIAYREMATLLGEYKRLSVDQDLARAQIARFYKGWFNKIETMPPAGRALALYQDLSSAYVFGKSLPELPRDEGTARRPERIAKQYMLSCL